MWKPCFDSGVSSAVTDSAWLFLELAKGPVPHSEFPLHDPNCRPLCFINTYFTLLWIFSYVNFIVFDSLSYMPPMLLFFLKAPLPFASKIVLEWRKGWKQVLCQLSHIFPKKGITVYHYSHQHNPTMTPICTSMLLVRPSMLTHSNRQCIFPLKITFYLYLQILTWRKAG